jgi:hypothetical protein
MRTTVRINDSLLDEAKRVAAESGTSLTSLIEEALRQTLAARKQRPNRPVHLTVFAGNGLQPGIDLDDSADLLDRMEAGGASS